MRNFVKCKLSTCGVALGKLIFLSSSRNSSHFMKPEGLLSCSQEPDICPRWNYFTRSHIISWRHTLILPTHLRLCLPSSLFPSSLQTKTVYALLLIPPNVLLCPPFALYRPNNISWHKFWSSHYAVSSSPCHLLSLGPKYIPQHPVFKNHQPVFFKRCKRPSFTPI